MNTVIIDWILVDYKLCGIGPCLWKCSDNEALQIKLNWFKLSCLLYLLHSEYDLVCKSHCDALCNCNISARMWCIAFCSLQVCVIKYHFCIFRKLFSTIKSITLCFRSILCFYFSPLKLLTWTCVDVCCLNLYKHLRGVKVPEIWFK